MRSYAQIAPTFWTRGSGRKLRGNQKAQVLALYFMTAPSSNLIGLYYLPLTTICHETGLDPEGVREAMGVESLREIVQYDFEQEIVFLPECARYQIGEAMEAKDKRRAAVERELLVFAGHEFHNEFLCRYGGPFGLRTVSKPKGLPSRVEGASKGLPAVPVPPFPAPVLDPDPDRGSPEGGEPDPMPPAPVAPDSTDSDTETVVPLDLVDRARRLGVFSQVLEHMPGVELVQLEDKAREFMGYWTIGKGAGKKRRHWMSRLREDLRQAYENNKLKPIGAIEHDGNSQGDKRQHRSRAVATEAMAAAYASAPKEVTSG